MISGQIVVAVDYIVVPGIRLEHPPTLGGQRIALQNDHLIERLGADLTGSRVPANCSGVKNVPSMGVEPGCPLPRRACREPGCTHREPLTTFASPLGRAPERIARGTRRAHKGPVDIEADQWDHSGRP